MTCANCGRPLEAERCPNCGWAKPATPNRAAALLVLIFLVMPFALIGACSVAVAVDIASKNPSNGSGIGQMVVMATAFLLVTVGALAISYRLWKG